MENNQEMGMEEVLKDYDFKRINRGEIVKGKVLSVASDEVIVNINYFSDGIISRDELSFDKDVNPEDVVKAGDEIMVKILSTDDGDGNVVLSKKRADEVKVWDEIKEIKDADKTITVKVNSETKGGLIASYKGFRVFIPGSLASAKRVELSTLVGKELEVKLTEVDRAKRNIVASRRVIEEAELKAARDKTLASIEAGQKREGTITRLASFGAFVDLGGVEGLIHISDLSWKRIHKPEEVVSVGDKVTVYVDSVDTDKHRIALVLKDKDSNPWVLAAAKFNNGDVIEGKVVKLMNFGAFVEVADGVEGLVHISEISEENIAKVSDVLKEGQQVKVKILDMDTENHKLSLSIKEASEKSKEYLEYTDNSDDEATVGDALKEQLNGVKFE